MHPLLLLGCVPLRGVLTAGAAWPGQRSCSVRSLRFEKQAVEGRPGLVLGSLGAPQSSRGTLASVLLGGTPASVFPGGPQPLSSRGVTQPCPPRGVPSLCPPCGGPQPLSSQGYPASVPPGGLQPLFSWGVPSFCSPRGPQPLSSQGGSLSAC